ncbi:hypothetical protein [Microbacterium lushaniae]|uniref:DUF4386 family protein n=1 Tax=Microbacterium lushaniae TaxID=2614639 RepID=A0A5J6L7M9_9MICO|nr:hypothetical protein [Microbacterium lushaniae]QEW04332.1 hypothetical protein F6J85_15375 [Microbacterium lushaniae]
MVAGAVLTGGALLLMSLLPGAPSNASEMAAWVESGDSLLSWSDELLFFAIICWGTAARGLFRINNVGSSVRTTVGTTGLAVALVALVVLLLELGRLVYPVYRIRLSGEAMALVVSEAFGALHLAVLGFTVAAVALSWSTPAGRIGRAFGILTGVAFALGSFPWLTPNWWNSVVAAVVAAWGVFLAFATVTGTQHARPAKDPRSSSSASRH